MQLTHGSPPALVLHNFVFQPDTPPLDLILRKQACVAVLGIGTDEDDLPRLTAALTAVTAPSTPVSPQLCPSTAP